MSVERAQERKTEFIKGQKKQVRCRGKWREHPTRNAVLACCEVSRRMEGGMQGRWMRLNGRERETDP